MNALVTDSDREIARGLAELFGGNGLSQNQQIELVAERLAEIRTRTPREAGRAAFKAGMRLNQNPHKPNSREFTEWASGHVAAEFES